MSPVQPLRSKLHGPSSARPFDTIQRHVLRLLHARFGSTSHHAVPEHTLQRNVLRRLRRGRPRGGGAAC